MTDSLETDLQETPVDALMSEDVASDNSRKDVFDNATVQKVVARERQKAYEKGKREAMMELQQAQQAPDQAQQQAQPSSLGGMQQLSPDDIQKMIAEQLPQHIHQQVQHARAEQTVNSFVAKMKAAEERHPGIEAKLNDLDYSNLSPVIEMANGLENTADIMAELVDNPMKMGNLLTLMHTQPKLAQKAMADLSNSIKQNQEALAQASQESVNNPIGQMKTSAAAGMNNGEMSISDWSKYYRNSRGR